MKHINKNGCGGYYLSQANQTPPQTSSQADSRWSSFGYKQKVLVDLLDEQYQLCCYSELRADQHGLGYHIEHVQNKSQAPLRTFDYANLAASALASEHIQAFKSKQQADLPSSLFAGHAQGKQRSVDMQRFVSPHQPDCARFFVYLSDGRIVPRASLNQQDQDRARYTIDLLNLNSPFLQVERRKWWDELETEFNQHFTKKWDLYCLAAVDLVPTAYQLSPFFSITRQFFDVIAEDVLNQYAPQLV